MGHFIKKVILFLGMYTNLKKPIVIAVLYKLCMSLIIEFVDPDEAVFQYDPNCLADKYFYSIVIIKIIYKSLQKNERFPLSTQLS